MLDHKAGPTYPPDPLAAMAALSVMAVQQSQPSMPSARHTIPSIAQRNLGLAWVEMVQKRRGASAAATAQNANKNNHLTGPHDKRNTGILRAKKQHETHTKFRSSLGPAKMQKITLAKSFKTKGLSKVVVCSLTPLVDIASGTMAATGALTSTFRFTTADDTVNGMTATMAATDTLIDGSTTDNDVLNITATGATAITTVNIETVNLVATSGTPNLDASAMSGVKTVNVSGTVASTVDNVSSAATINLAGYTRVLTIDDTNYDGTTANGNADVLNLSVSGATHGSTTATQSGVTLVSDNASVVETLNIASTGTAANAFTLDASTNVTLSTVNVTGATDATIRVANADISGLTFNATAATGNVSLVIDRAGVTTTATNANLFSGVDDLVLIDSTTPAVGGDGGSVSGLTVGQKITFADDFNASVLAFSSATGTTDTATIVLDNETAATDTDVAQINIQNIETLVITSSGFATSTSTTAENLIDDLVGDATTITVGGDTSLDLDLNIDAATSGTRTVVVNASTNTAFVNIEAAAGAGATSAITVAYNITGTAGNDTLALNAIGGTLAGGAGNDILTGSALNDTISTGAGTDTVFATTGTDAVTFGAGVDTIVFGEADVTGIAQVSTIAAAALDTTHDIDQLITVTIDGTSYSQAFATNHDTTIANFITAHGATILASHGVTVSTVDAGGSTSDGTLTFTGAASGAAFVISATGVDGGALIPLTVTATTAAVSGVSVATGITSFTTGTGGDVISIDISEMNAVTGIDTVRDSTDDVAGGDDALITAYTGAAVTMAAPSNVIKVGFSNAINSAADVLTLIDAGNITVANAVSSTDKIIITFYDADAGTMIVGLLQSADAVTALDESVRSSV